MPTYFKKISWQRPFLGSDGRYFPFVTVGSGDDRIGILVLDETVPEDAQRITDIRSAIGKHSSVTEITADQFEELKKKRTEPVSPKVYQPASRWGGNAPLQVMHRPKFRGNRDAGGAAPAASVAPASPPPVAPAAPATAAPPLAPVAPRRPRVARLSTLGKPAPVTAPAEPAAQ